MRTAIQSVSTNVNTKEAIITHKEKVKKLIKIGREIVNTLRFTDRIAVLADCQDELLQEMDQIPQNVSDNTRISRKKTKIMVRARNHNKVTGITPSGGEI